MTTAATKLPEATATLHGSEHKAYYPALDGLRALAVLMVFGEHYFHLPMGWAGVDLFFVLSGYLITGILWNTRARPGRLRVFYMRRVLRIFPLYYSVFLLLLLSTPWLHFHWDRDSLSWLVYLGNWSFYIDLQRFVGGHTWGVLQGSFKGQPLPVCIGHFWSLCVEEQFYLFWPFLMYALGSRGKILRVCAGVVLFMPFVRLLAAHVLPDALVGWGGEMLYHFTFFRIDALLLGAFLSLALMTRHRPLIETLAFPALATSLALIALLCLARHALHPATGSLLRDSLDFRLRWMSSWGLSLVDIVAGSLIVLSFRTGTWWYRLLTLPPLRWLGMRSYGFYVYHYLLLNELQMLFRNRPHPDLRVAACGFSIALVLCWASFRYLETPFLRIKDRFA